MAFAQKGGDDPAGAALHLNGVCCYCGKALPCQMDTVGGRRTERRVLRGITSGVLAIPATAAGER